MKTNVILENVRHAAVYGLALCGMLALLMCAGCSGAGSGSGSDSGSGSGSGTGTGTGGGTTTDTTGDTTVEQEAAVDEMDFSFTDRDKDATVNQSEATTIVLSGTTAKITGSGATASSKLVTITSDGTYILSGTFTGQILVNVPEDAKPQIVLNGVTIINPTGACINIQEGDKCFITLVQGTTNSLTDGANYSFAAGEDEPNAALYSKCDLTLNGSGALKVNGKYKYAINCKDDLAITGGTYTIESVEDGVRGKDSLLIADGTFSVTATEDGFVSNEDEDADKGYLYIEGGTFTVKSGDDGFSASHYLKVTGGTFDVTSSDKAFVCDTDMEIAGGTFAITAKDKAFTCDYALVVSGGTIDVASCFEGLEGEKVYVSGGTVHIVASDDAINAASSDESSADSPWGGGMRGFAEGGMGLADENCLISISGGYLSLVSSGDTLDSNGSITISGGVLLCSGPVSDGDATFDYDLTATITGGTVLMVGSSGMAQNFTSGTQPFIFTSYNGKAGQSVAVVDESGTVLVSLTAKNAFEVVQASSAAMTEGGSYTVVVGGKVAQANEDGYASSGTVSGGSSVTVSASTTATQGYGGLGSDGNPMNPGQGGNVRTDKRNSPGGQGGGGMRFF